ncbi:hypothetical protein QJQ45_027885 [Haematococcus lacustris]|nr:hypothetical protein QJQ45_027885 [Haematococcus lacustris]
MARVDARVVQDLIRFCAPQLPYADDQLLLQLYQSVAAIPHTSTKVRFQSSDGLVFNGPYSSGMPARAMLLIAFQNHTQPLLAKFTLDPTDIEHEHRVLSALADVPGIVGPVRLVRCSSGDFITPASGVWCKLTCGVVQVHAMLALVDFVCTHPGQSVPTKCALLMPLYPATLQHVPCPMDTACLLRCGQQLKNTLDCIHDKGYGHNDIKAANVFLDSKGE